MPVERAKREKVLIIKDVGSLIITIRNQKVIVDRDLAEIYGVETRRLNEQVKRNPERFPEDFMFQLTKEEADFWARSRSQIAISKRGKNIKYLPYAFTEHGAIMAANVLNSPQAVRMNVYVVRAFVKLREILATHKELAHKLAELERKLQNHDESIRSLVVAIRQLMRPLEPEPQCILERCTDPLEREFYIRMTKKFGWTKSVLIRQIENQSYEKTLLGQTNFDKALTPKLRAIMGERNFSLGFRE